jgi:hypothetical protein
MAVFLLRNVHSEQSVGKHGLAFAPARSAEMLGIPYAKVAGTANNV